MKEKRSLNYNREAYEVVKAVLIDCQKQNKSLDETTEGVITACALFQELGEELAW